MDRAAARGRGHLRARVPRGGNGDGAVHRAASCPLVRGGRVAWPGRRAQRGLPPGGRAASRRGGQAADVHAVRGAAAGRVGLRRRSSRKFNYYQSGYDPNWASRSVGLVLLARTVQDAFAEGLQEFDFLHGNESYKRDWPRGERWTIQMRLWRGARGRAARAAL